MNKHPRPENNQMSENLSKQAPLKRTPQPTMRRDGGPAALMPGEKARNFKGSMKQLLSYMGKYKWIILLVMLIASVSMVFAIFGPKILGQATTALYEGVTRMIAGDPRGIDFAEITQFLLRVLALYLGSAMLDLIQGFLMTSVASDITYRFRREISEKINRLPLSYFDHITHGEVLSRVTNDVDTISQTLNQSLSQMVSSLVGVIGILIMMLTINVQMTLIALTIVPLSILI
ncbi:MAG: ABC transporter ATP-binding protein, partial [Anaerolineales bacterium]|nr:ABC transporter ATP-binding protein [Anaerolineales bacterium]